MGCEASVRPDAAAPGWRGCTYTHGARIRSLGVRHRGIWAGFLGDRGFGSQSAEIPEAQIRRSADPALLFLMKRIT